MNVENLTRILNPRDPTDRARIAKMENAVWAMRALFIGGDLNAQEGVSAIASFIARTMPPSHIEEVLSVLAATVRMTVKHIEADFDTEGNA